MSRNGRVMWLGRPAMRLDNGVVQLAALDHGGHLAELRFSDTSDLPSQNVFWDPPWMAEGVPRDPESERTDTAGMCGHGLCLDYFGPPSPAEAAHGLGIHGEAAALEWHGSVDDTADESALAWSVPLPFSQLEFKRRIVLCKCEAVFRFEETVTNLASRNHPFQWVQHVTFGPPFLASEESELTVSAVRGFTDDAAYGAQSAVAHGQEFSWPIAPGASGNSFDLSTPFQLQGSGMLAALELDRSREFEFVIAVNRRLHLGVGYCFHRRDFPWMAVWEENRARADAPWHGITQARGMEFGTTPLPLGREETLRRGPRDGIPCWRTVPGLGKCTARYIGFLFDCPDPFVRVADVQVEANGLALIDAGGAVLRRLPAQGIQAFFEAPGARP